MEREDVLVASDGLQDTVAPEAGSQEAPPAWFAESMAALRQEMRTAQGQANAASRETAALRAQLSGLMQRPTNTPQMEDDIVDLLKRVDDSDGTAAGPLKRSVIKLLERDRQREQELAQLKGHFQREQFTAAEIAEQRRTLGELTDLGLSEDNVRRLNGLNAIEMWQEGKKLLKGQGGENPKKAAVKASGAFDEVPGAGRSRTTGREHLTLKQLGAMKPEEIIALGLTEAEEAAIYSRKE